MIEVQDGNQMDNQFHDRCHEFLMDTVAGALAGYSDVFEDMYKRDAHTCLWVRVRLISQYKMELHWKSSHS